MKPTREERKANKKETIIFSFVHAISAITANLPKDEANQLKVALREPVKEILNDRLDYTKQYKENFMRGYYTTNIMRLAEIKAGLDIALLNEYITKRLRENLLYYVKSVENLLIDTMNDYYTKRDKSKTEQ